MHLDIITRGIKRNVDKMIADLGSYWFPWPGSGMDVQVAVRPIQLWEIVMPRANLHDVMRMLWNGTNPHNEHGFKEWAGTKALQKALKLQPIPKFDEKIPRYRLYNQDMSIVPIGVKDDKDHEGPDPEHCPEYL